MTEPLIHYLWKFRLLGCNLRTSAAEPVVVIDPGLHNQNAGPDFLGAKIRIGNTTWAGNVEIHVKASDWYRHEHQNDPAYSNIILHVVEEDDVPVSDRSGNPVATLSVRNAFDPAIEERYAGFAGNQKRIPCENLLPGMDTVNFTSWAPALAMERFAARCERFLVSWQYCRNDWEECFYHQLARAFGFRINGDVFENLARSLPLKILRRHVDSVFSMEALFFGQAGLTDYAEEGYPTALQQEYLHFQQKYHLRPLPPGLPRFLRLRPSNFPTLRISQLCDLLSRRKDVFDAVLHAQDTGDLYHFFSVTASPYWDNHFVFGKLSPPSVKSMGESSKRLLILNFVIPFIYFYGEMKKQNDLKEKALSFLEQEAGESNSIIDHWSSLGIPVNNALYTQALLQLTREYCDKKRCLECRIGIKLLQ